MKTIIAILLTIITSSAQAHHARRVAPSAVCWLFCDVQSAQNATARPNRHGGANVRRLNVPEDRLEPAGRVRVSGASQRSGVALIRSSSGATAYVAVRAQGSFQCLIGALEGEGYPIKFMGGQSSGHMRNSLHHSGMALDVNQYSRNVTKPHMPRNEITLANSCGLISGAQWRHGDSGHFQSGGWSGR